MKINKMNSLNRIFTRNMLRLFIDGKENEVYSAVIRRYINNTEQKNNQQLISEIYSILKKNYRNEYFYKNTLLNKLLLGVHSVNTTTALTEVAIAKSKADFVLINGKAVVYEIKTELDNLERLNSQLEDYYKAFDHVAVVTYEKNLLQLQKILEFVDKPVGIYVLRRNGSLGMIREPRIFRESMDKKIIFKLLSKNKYKKILKYYGELPQVTQFKYYSACKEEFFKIPIEESYIEVLKVLKERMQIVKEEFVKVPYELRFLAYFMDLKIEDYQKLEYFLECKYEGA